MYLSKSRRIPSRLHNAVDSFPDVRSCFVLTDSGMEIGMTERRAGDSDALNVKERGLVSCNFYCAARDARAERRASSLMGPGELVIRSGEI